MFYKVITASKSAGIGSGLTYESKEQILPGVAIKVPLRKSIVDGMVLEVMEGKKPDYDLKQVTSVVSSTPFLSEAQLQTMQWMSSEYCCSQRQALGPWLPAPPWSELLEKPSTYIKLINPDIPLRGAKQKEVHEYLLQHVEVLLDTLKKETGASGTVIASLKEKGITESEERVDDIQSTNPVVSRPRLTDVQTKAVESIVQAKAPSLLFGVTGSGKTEVYAELIADCIKNGKQAILLVPEILLTENCVQRFHDLLDDDSVVLIHSKLTIKQRRDAWRKVYNGRGKLVIGSRSALFAPCRNLGLVIIDEEHEWTYKNEQTPRYHARSVAEKLCEYSEATLVLGTATPSIESWAKVKNGLYNLVELPKRYKDAPMPDVKIIDLATVNFGSVYPFSPPLLEAIEDRLKKGEQSVLFINRRGIATSLLCLDCRRRIVSPDSNLPYTLHRSNGTQLLIDHTTGSCIPVPDTCPHCLSTRLFAVGAGTQGVEDILCRQFPEARILRADADTLKHPEQMRLLLKKMKERNADVLLGTQSVVKGLDLPGVTLAAVLLADVGLSLPHFRSGERIFQLLSQLSGRSGRSVPGEVIIQTFRPNSPEILAASNHSTAEYLDTELKLRKHFGYPPYGKLVRIIVRGTSPSATAQTLSAALSKKAVSASRTETVTAAQTLFSGGKVWHVFVKGEDSLSLLQGVDLTDCIIDTDPYELV